MKKFILPLCLLILSSCAITIKSVPPTVETVVIRDTVVVPAMTNGTFTYNVPCRTVYIHQELPGKSIMLLWLHGGVGDVAKHDFYSFNHLDCVEADEFLLDYLERKGIKAIALFPVCHKSTVDHTVIWKDCYPDVKKIMDDYISKGMIDVSRIYLTGSSDGGTGTWDYAEFFPEMFAAGMALSCGRPRMTTLPVYFYNTNSEKDYTKEVEALKAKGSNILDYQHFIQYKHGEDAAVCTDEFLDNFFSHRRK